MDRSMMRGAAAAVLALAIVPPASAQSGGSAGTRRVGDSVFLRVMSANVRARLDSISVVMRALQDEPASSERSAALRHQLEVMMTALRESDQTRVFTSPRILFKRGAEVSRQFEERRFPGWIGITTDAVPHQEFVTNDEYFVRYYAHPPIISVDQNSPAQRAGIAPGDVLVAYDGEDVVGRTLNITRLLAPEKRLSVTVRREGETRDYSMVVEPAPSRVSLRRLESDVVPLGAIGRGQVVRGGFAGGDDRHRTAAVFGEIQVQGMNGTAMPGMSILTFRPGILGASLMDLKPELARVLKLEAGVLLEDVPEPTPAFKVGLRTGDVIVTAGGRPVNSVRELIRYIAARRVDKPIALQIVRDRKPLTVTVNPEVP